MAPTSWTSYRVYFPFQFTMRIAPAGVLMLDLVVAGCGGSGGAVQVPTNPTLASIAVTGGTTVADNGTVQFSATAKDTNGNTMSGVTFTWASSATSYATINGSGLASGAAPGTTQITASAQGVTSTPVTLNVTTGPLAAIAVAGATTVADNATDQFTATAKDSLGYTISGVTFTWASSATSYATINGSGLASGAAPGTTQITGSAQGITSAPVNLNVTTGPLATITVAGAATVAVNATDQLTATAEDGAGYAISGLVFAWQSSATNYVTISNSGVASGVAQGAAQITASASGVTSAPFFLTVTAAPVPTSLSFNSLAALNYLGLPLSPAVTVSVLDQNGNVDTGATGFVTLALGANPTSTTLSGTLQASVVNGVATSSNLTVDYPGVSYTLTATFDSLPIATSSPFTVLANHSSPLSIEGQAATPTNWYTHTNASFTATASASGLVSSSLESQLDAGVAVPWTTQPQETVSYSNLASTPHTITLTGQTPSGATDASTLTWVDCANLDTATSQPMPPTSSTCANLTIPQSFATGGFSGNADPTMRMDPATGTLWLGYSWPHAWNPGANSTDVVDLYLTSSSDNGVTWGTPSPLWTSYATTDPTNGNAAYTSTEILNILPGQVNGQSSETWFSIHMIYYVDVHTPIIDALVTKSSMVLNWATTPTGLSTAPASQTFTFTANGTDSQIPTDMNLTTLDPSLANCQQWGEPALLMKNGNLYMALLCKYGTSSTSMQPAKNFYGVFEAMPNLSQPPAQWGWQYNGVLAGPAQSALLEGHQFMNELDLATRADGSIVASVSPADDIANGSGGVTQYTYGCRELLVQGLDKGNVGMASDVNGQLEVLASITASDLGPANGDSQSGACTYEPLASNGVVFVRVYTPDTRFPSQGYFASLFNTYVMP